MKTKAAVLYEYGKPFVVEEIELEGPKEKEVLVNYKVAGVCHSDLSVMKGNLPFPPLPAVLGHEASGIVKEVGPGVTKVKPGDHILMMWSPICGQCRNCVKGLHMFCESKSPLRNGTLIDGTHRIRKGNKNLSILNGVGAFSEFNVVSELSLVPIDPDISFDVALFGCAYMTGIGSVFNKARVQPGDAVAIIGIGGVGLNVIQGAHLAHATKIIAIDVLDNKLEAARRFGATHVINAKKEDPIKRVMDITGGLGVDYAFEAIGKPETALMGYNLLARGGSLIVLGISDSKALITVSLFNFPISEKNILGSNYGSGDMRKGLKMLIELYKAGKIKLEEMITKRYSLQEINEAFRDLEEGKNLRGVIMYQ
jgi:S-(hydroxymethyl)glutathione dehydrogenase/alcohol dehydrogenase